MLGIGGVGAATALTDHGGTTPASVTALSPPSSTVSSSPSPVPAPSSAPAPRPHRTPTVGFAVAVTARVSWVSVTLVNRRVLYAGLLRHGHMVTFRQRPIDVVIGDAGAVRLTLHGHLHAPAGHSGAVLRFRVR